MTCSPTCYLFVGLLPFERFPFSFKLGVRSFSGRLQLKKNCKTGQAQAECYMHFCIHAVIFSIFTRPLLNECYFMLFYPLILQEVFEQQKELILLAETVVLATLGFDLNVHHPYKPLVEAIKKFKVDQKTLARIAWNFVNDGYACCLS